MGIQGWMHRPFDGRTITYAMREPDTSGILKGVWINEEDPKIFCIHSGTGWYVLDSRRTPQHITTRRYATPELAIVAWRVTGGSY